MRSIIAMIRAAYLTAASYRFAMVISLAGVLVMFVPIYFIAGAVQPIAADAIQAEGGNYFAFIIIGMAGTYLFTTAAATLPGALSGAISSGTLEALLVTRTPLPHVLVGFVGYGVLWSVVRVVLLVAGAAVVGVDFTWTRAPLAVCVLLIMMVAYFAFGLVAAALVLMFRTSGPFVSLVLMGSGLLGGVYYPTTVIPSWLERLSVLVPATHALRPVRALLLNGAPLQEVAGDLLILVGYTGLLMVLTGTMFTFALRYAKSAGTLSQY